MMACVNQVGEEQLEGSTVIGSIDYYTMAYPATCRSCIDRSYIASTPGPTELVGPGSRPLALHGWSLGNAIAQKHHYDNAHKQLTVCWKNQELFPSMHGE